MSQAVNDPIDPQSPIDPTTNPSGGQEAGVLFLATSRITGTYNSSEHYNRGARGVRLNVVISPTGPATGTATFKIQVADPVTSTWTDLSGATGFAINGTGALTGALITVYPGILTGASSANQHLGPRWRAVAVTTLDTLTFSVGADYLL